MRKRNTIKASVILTLALVIMIVGASCGFVKESIPKNLAETNAVLFIEIMYAGNAQACTDLQFDDRVSQMMEFYECATEDVYVYALNKRLETTIENYKDDYGKNWKHKVIIVDSYNVNPPDGYSEYEFMDVVLNVQHEGRKLIFFPREGTEEILVQMIKKDNVWYVFDVNNVII